MEKFISTHLMEIGFVLILLYFVSRFILYATEVSLPVEKNTAEIEDVDEEAESAPIQFQIPPSVDAYLAGPSKIRLGSSYVVCKYLFPTLFNSTDPISEAGNKSHEIHLWYVATFKDLRQMYAYGRFWNSDHMILLYPGEAYDSGYRHYPNVHDTNRKHQCKVAYVSVLDGEGKLIGDLGKGVVNLVLSI